MQKWQKWTWDVCGTARPVLLLFRRRAGVEGG